MGCEENPKIFYLIYQSTTSHLILIHPPIIHFSSTSSPSTSTSYISFIRLANLSSISHPLSQPPFIPIHTHPSPTHQSFIFHPPHPFTRYLLFIFHPSGQPFIPLSSTLSTTLHPYTHTPHPLTHHSSFIHLSNLSPIQHPLSQPPHTHPRTTITSTYSLTTSHPLLIHIHSPPPLPHPSSTTTTHILTTGTV